MSGVVAITGAEGQLGRALTTRLGPRAMAWSRRDCDITSDQSIRSILAAAGRSGRQPDVLINAAAYNAVDAAEGDRATAFAVNAEGPRRLAAACAELGIRFVQISTDYVFGNGPAPADGWRESDEPICRCVYAESKRAGELAVLGCAESSPLSALVVRTCGLYGAPAAHGKRSFVEAILQRAAAGQPLRVVDDQRCTPTSVDDLVVAIFRLLETPAEGLIHVVNAGSCTWFEFAREILRLAGIEADITPIASAELNQRAARPVDSRLCTALYERISGHPLPVWKTALAARLRDDGTLKPA